MCLNRVVYLSQQPPQKEDPMSTDKFAGRAEDLTFISSLNYQRPTTTEPPVNTEAPEED